MNILIALLIIYINVIDIESLNEDLIPEDGRMNFTELAFKYGQICEEHKIITEDGYILMVFRIKGDITKPVLMNHGLLDTSDSYILRGNTSLAITLARSGFDVWAMNVRGNRYSRSHVNLDPDKNRTFWHFSGHEYGFYDAPATIDYILNITGQRNLSLIGFSEGTFTFFVMGATRPEYNEKVKIFISLAPVLYLHNMRPFLSVGAKYFPYMNRGFLTSQTEEVMGFNSPAKLFLDLFCTLKEFGYDVCMRGIVFSLTGVDSEEIEHEFLPVISGHFPAGTSRQNLHHFSQIIRRKRPAMYDYGRERNLDVYKSKVPPDYDLKSITMNVALFVAKNDPIATREDVTLLRKRMPNVVKFKMMGPEKFNHIDFIWGRNTHKILFPDVIDILETYK